MKETICTVILTKNEELHLTRILDQLVKIIDHILIVDSGSTDRTINISKTYDCEVITKQFKNHASQFNFGLKYLKNKFDWILRIDADEYFEDIKALSNLIHRIQNGHYNKINGISFNRRIKFLERSIKFGGIFPTHVVRLFRTKFGICENRWMDEHIIVNGDIIHEDIMIIDENKMGLEFWLKKHINYAKREAVEMLFIQHRLTYTNKNYKTNSQASLKRNLKENYYSRLPLFWRPALYFFYRYVIRMGFLDGKIGFVYHFLHAFWYRLVVDLFIYRVILAKKKEDTDIKIVIKDILQIDA